MELHVCTCWKSIIPFRLELNFKRNSFLSAKQERREKNEKKTKLEELVTISGEYCREYTERNEKRASQHVLKMADNKKTLYSKARS